MEEITFHESRSKLLQVVIGLVLLSIFSLAIFCRTTINYTIDSKHDNQTILFLIFLGIAAPWSVNLAFRSIMHYLKPTYITINLISLTIQSYNKRTTYELKNLGEPCRSHTKYSVIIIPILNSPKEKILVIEDYYFHKNRAALPVAIKMAMGGVLASGFSS